MQQLIGIIVSRFNETVTEKLLEGARSYLVAHGLTEDDYIVAHVPGAYEIPVLAKKMLRQKEYIGVIALGAVIRGETSHYDFVAGDCSRGLMTVMLDTEKPIAMGVLTTDNLDQALARAGGKKGNKGKDAAETLLEMITLMKEV
jgi:6,7-dimethyl-8-ribityllumazine synthase